MDLVKRFEIYLVNLDTEMSRDAKNTRPCVVVSPDELNEHLSTVMIAPISASGRVYPTCVPAQIINSERFVILNQLRTVDTARLVKRIGQVDENTQNAILEILQEMFAR